LANSSTSSDEIPINVTRIAITMVSIALALCLSAFGFYRFQTSDPYISQVLAQPGNIAQGEVIFNLNCAACHGMGGTGLVGPSLEKVSHHKSELGLIRQVISGKTPPMPKFQPSPEIMADLLSYLESL
jgi:mono/diheme cytochrome c family protein